ncbi:DNA polymerase type B, organellar and viral [Popillia japonica]|uniref:DNA-directed DNA polymerase n=1 Tax=Popillia japonica TaxID=7064 RepID=A0AAW1L407_POPJA
MERRYEDTCAKNQRLREAGDEVLERWECDFRNEMTDEIMTYTENHELLRNTPLNPHDAFYGGRTGASKMYHTAVEGEKIKYVDVCSLYPWTNKYGKYPVGHPKVHYIILFYQSNKTAS